ncbi:MAG: hypothetical protein OQL19_16585 [Gammaproteobacteria bacterium]|nr:hypothetical protein [Gammaproteobacteria bacterium]
MTNIATIQIDISGPVATGKSAIASSIGNLLKSHGYCVAFPERNERHNPSEPLDKAPSHEKPKPDSTVIVITEKCI